MPADVLLSLVSAVLICLALVLVFYLIKHVTHQQRPKTRKVVRQNTPKVERNQVVLGAVIGACIVIYYDSSYLPYAIIAAWVSIASYDAKQKTQQQTSSNSAPDSSVPFPHLDVRPETQRKLFAMCNGDRKLAIRLGGHDQWGWEKAIADLERDRR